MMYHATPFECSRIAQDLQIRKVQVECVVQLFNEGNTVPFIARYRKERTGGLDEEALRQIQGRLNFVKQLNDRKQTIVKTIETHGKLTDDLRQEIVNAPTVRRLEDLYLPFKAKKKSLALPAREKGLEPLALAIWHSDPAVANLDELWLSLMNPEKHLNTPDDVRTGVIHILAEMINETAAVRATVRRTMWKTGVITSTRNEKVHEGQGNEFKPYFQYKEAAQDIRPHRILAINRGEKEGVLKVKLEVPQEVLQEAALKALAEYLLKVAGQPMLLPAAPDAPAALPPQEAPSPQPEASAAAPPEAPVPTPEVSTNMPAAAPDATPEAPAPAAPLVAALSTEIKPVLSGDPLVSGFEFRSPHVAFLQACLDDALQRLLLPGLEREIRNELTDEAELHAVKIFAHNIRSLLMQPPLVERRVLAIDPGFRTGCRLVALDESGKLLDHLVIYPHGGGPGGGRRKEKKPKDQPPAPVTAAPAENPVPPAASEPAPASVETPTPPSAPAESPPVEAAVAAPPMAEPLPALEAPPTPEPSASEPVAPPAAAPSAPPEPPAVDRRAEAKTKIVEFVQKHQLNTIAIGNGSACRETEEIVAEVIASNLPDLSYVIVSEAGASAYSVSPAAKEEFPDLDAGVRVAISIGRRLQDPLAELVKIEPQSLSLGLYSHDMSRRELKDSLEAVVESCVNQVGVDVNTASAALLRQVSGMNQLAAREIVEHRKTHGPFTSREQLQHIPGMGPTRYTQAIGFLKIPTAHNPLDRTWIHPESYLLVEKVFAELGCTASVFDTKASHDAFRDKLNDVDLASMAAKLGIAEPTLDEIFMALASPGRDPRQDLSPPIFKKGVLKLDDLQPGMELKGTVLNVVDFGAFVDVGLKESGLVHISQMANKYIKSPYDVVSVNDIVRVWVLKINKETNHVSLTMINPAGERKPPERRPPAPRREGEGERKEQRPPQQHGRGPGGPPREGQRHGGRPPRRGGPSRHGQPRESAPPAPPPAPLPPAKPKREPPKPKLTQAAIEGKAPLRTLSELAAFFAAKEEKEKAPPAPVEEKKEPSPQEPPADHKPPEPPPADTPPPS